MLFTIITGVAGIGSIIVAIWHASAVKRKYKKEMMHILGAPAGPELIEELFIWDGLPKPVILHYFIRQTPMHELTENICGIGLIAHPDFPKDAYYCRLVFKSGKPILADAKTHYWPTRDMRSDILYLKVRDDDT